MLQRFSLIDQLVFSTFLLCHLLNMDQGLQPNKEQMNFPTVLKDMPLPQPVSFSSLDGILLFRITTWFITFILCSYKYHSVTVNLFSEVNTQGILSPIVMLGVKALRGKCHVQKVREGYWFLYKIEKGL